MNQFATRYKDRNVTLRLDPPPQLRQGSRRPSLARSSSSLAGALRSQHDPNHLTHMLLYLNNETFVGETGQTLSAEVRRARALGIEIVLAHENDPARGGCPFNRLFQSTPHELVTEVTQALELRLA
eukprot:5316880-Prymnesium_polylepis.1